MTMAPQTRYMQQAPIATAGIDVNRAGRANVMVTGVDMNRDGIPDVLEQGRPMIMSRPITPVATARIDVNRAGRANVMVTGVDMNRDGIPDVLEQGRPMIMSRPLQAQPQAVIEVDQVNAFGQVVERDLIVGPGQGYPDMMGLFTEERARREQLEVQMQAVLIELAACKARLDKLDPPPAPETPLQKGVKMIEARGNIRVNHQTGHVTLVRKIDFMPRTTKDKPIAIFRDIAVAEAICRDIAEVCNLFGCPMTIEGHTKGGESDFWKTLAGDRASKVAELMIEFGANGKLLRTKGLPGRMGKNEVRTEVYMDVSNIKDERAAVYERDVIVGGKVVEREMIQAGRVVERDVAKVAVMERDVMVGGRVVERDFTNVISAERDLVGFDGKTAEVEARAVGLGSTMLTKLPISMAMRR